jgi:hypothetical protein
LPPANVRCASGAESPAYADFLQSFWALNLSIDIEGNKKAYPQMTQIDRRWKTVLSAPHLRHLRMVVLCRI